ncbi:MFS transporter [Stutzerimonas balearica]|uniref:MFS transporter n=1 Tax=Stutzerimonas balearica TaxID=74829 RepID=UPI0028B0714B|nr:MFS transporter [Stutzerimonas balearica]
MNPGSTQPVQLAMLINMLSIGSLMMVMPLGPDFVRELGMAAEHIGYIAGGATLASALSAAACAAWLDRLERKRALVVLLALRFALLLACAGVTSAGQLILLFVLSGLVAGPMGAVLMASMLDLIPPAERGRKLAHVAMGFSLATPAALELSRLWGWRMPFLLFGGLGLALAVACIALFPSPRRHPRAAASLLPLLRTPLCLGALALVALQMAGHFLLVPHFANFFEFNLGFARDQLGLLYLCGGLASIASMRIGGGLIDRGHAAAVALTSSGLLALVTLLGFVLLAPLPLFVTFALFMALSALRTSSTTTILAGIPAPNQRAAFMALQGTVSNVAAGLGSLASARYLGTDATGALLGFERLAGLNALAGLAAGAGVLALLDALRRRAQATAPTTTSQA